MFSFKKYLAILLLLSSIFMLYAENLCLTGNSKKLTNIKINFDYSLYSHNNNPVNMKKLFPDLKGEHPCKLFDGKSQTNCVFYGGFLRAEIIVFDFKKNYIFDKINIYIPKRTFKKFSFSVKKNNEGIWHNATNADFNIAETTKAGWISIPLKSLEGRYLKVQYTPLVNERPVLGEIEIIGSPAKDSGTDVAIASCHKQIKNQIIVHPANCSNNKLYIVQGIPAHVIFLQNQKLNFNVKMEIPVDYKIIPQEGVSILKKEFFSLKNKKYKRLTLSPFKNKQSVFIEPPLHFSSDNQDYLIYYSAGPKGVSEKESIELVNCGKFTPPSLPRHFFIGVYNDFRALKPSADIFNKFMDTYCKLGIRGGGKIGWNKQMVEKGWLTIPFWPFFAYKLQDSYPKPDHKLNCIDRNGKKLPGTFCPTYIAAGDNIFSQKFKEFETKLLLNPDGSWGDYALIDFEPFHQECFCPECIKSFKEKNNLNINLNAAKILADYRTQWLNFRYWQNGQIIKKMREILTTINSKAKLIICSNYVKSPKEKSHDSSSNAVDPSYWQNWTDINMPMIYQSGTVFYDALARTQKKLSKPTWPITAIYEYMIDGKGYLLQEIKMNILASAALGAPAVFLYEGQCNFDGRIYLMLAEVMNFISKVENYYQQGENAINTVTLSFGKHLSKYIRYTAKRINDKTLVTIFNYNREKSLTVILKCSNLKKGSWQLKNACNDKYFRFGNKTMFSSDDLKRGLTLKINSFDYLPVIIEPASISPAKQYININSNKAENSKNRNSSFKAIKKNGIQIIPTGNYEAGNFRINISTPGQEVSIDSSHGGIISSWKLKGAKEIILQNSAMGIKQCGAAVDLFWYPSTAVWSGDEKKEYKLKSYLVSNHDAVIFLETKLNWGSLSGLIISKKITVSGSQTAISIQYNLKNTRNDSIVLGFWSHNVFSIDSQQNNELPFVYRINANKLYIKNGLKPFFVKEQNIFNKKTVFLGIQNANTHNMVSTNIPGSELESFFCWRAPNLVPTLEWRYKKINLAPESIWSTKFTLNYTGKQ